MKGLRSVHSGCLDVPGLRTGKMKKRVFSSRQLRQPGLAGVLGFESPSTISALMVRFSQMCIPLGELIQKKGVKNIGTWKKSINLTRSSLLGRSTTGTGSTWWVATGHVFH